VTNLQREYYELAPLLDRLGANIQTAILQFLAAASIDVLAVTHRTKAFTSFLAKVHQKRYADPFLETPDLCGVRVIAFSPSDLGRIGSIISGEFSVREVVMQETRLQEDQFGYRSDHYVVTLPDTWLGAPNYRGLAGLQAEIQVRTILMHAWANLSHRLSYKSIDQSPLQFRRRIFQLSALFEMADEEFDRLLSQKLDLQQALIRSAEDDPRGFDVLQPLNLDSLQAYLDFRFSDRVRLPHLTPDLLSELIDKQVTLKDLEKGYQSVKDTLPQQERELFAAGAQLPLSTIVPVDESERRWNQLGVVRQILDVTFEPYWNSRREHLPEYVQVAVDKWRNVIASRSPNTA